MLRLCHGSHWGQIWDQGLADVGAVPELSPGSQGDSVFPPNQDLMSFQTHKAPFLNLTPYSVSVRSEMDPERTHECPRRVCASELRAPASCHVANICSLANNSQNVLREPETSASPGNLLETPILRLHSVRPRVAGTGAQHSVYQALLVGGGHRHS